jgi:hypothetical protein
LQADEPHGDQLCDSDGDKIIMEDFAYLSYDAKTNKASLTDEFIGQMAEAFDGLRNMRREYLEATDAVVGAQMRLESAERDVIVNELNKGANAEVRKAKLEEIVAPMRHDLFTAKNAQRHAEHSMQSCLDAVRMYEDVLQAVKVGVVFMVPDMHNDDFIKNGMIHGVSLN